MWDQFRSFLSFLADFFIEAAASLWAGFKWLALFLAAAAKWLWQLLVKLLPIAYDLALNHHYALLAMVLVLFVGFLITNMLQKKKSFVYIPWYKNPKIQPFILIPIIMTLLGLVVSRGSTSVFSSGITSVDDYLGPPGYLGIPTTIWAVLISIALAWLAGVIALRHRKAPPPVIKAEGDDAKGREAKKDKAKVRKWWDD